MHFSIIYRIIFFTFCALACIHVNAQPPLKICLTGRIVENLSSYGKSVLNATDLALAESSIDKEQIEVKPFFYNNRPLEPIHVYNKMLKYGCASIIGFEYLSDLLLATDNQENEQIPIFTSYASTTKTDTLPQNVFIFMPSYNFFAHQMLMFLHSKFNNINKVLLVTEINRDEMQKYKNVYSKELNNEGIKFETFDFLEHDNQVNKKLASFLNGKRYNYVFLLSGAIAASKIADIMNNKNTIFIGTETFGSSVSQTFYTRLNNKNIRSYFIRNLDFFKTDALLSEYKKKYMEKFHSDPTVLSIYVYEATNLILKSFKETGGSKTKNILNITYNTGITGAYLKKNKLHRSNKYVILSVGKDGYKYEE